ncbi:MAG TPA: DUF1549 and DUF1553 domain-containing protein [Planctomycetota bacterium]|nr:DUF1549 and DUF1553 domain-containing protein [Planctomycetota bacterium]
MPVFFRSGCNSGGCHGSARGKDGFRLSLFGYDPAGDYFRITQQIAGRRINLAVPEESLILLKATGKVPHTGGELFKTDSARYAAILKWIQAGAPDDGADVPTPTGIKLVPEKWVVEGAGKKQQARVLATFSDGSTRDVTKLALFVTNNKTVVDIDADGLITSGKNGAAFVFARFNKFTIGSEAIVLPTDAFKWPDDVKARNYIDELVHAKLQNLHILPSEICNDEQFVRRIYLDLIGLPPKPDEYRAFMADTSADKREKLVDALLKRDEFADLWAAKWSEWVKVITDNNGNNGADRKAAVLYHDWIREQFKKNTPLNEFVRAQVTGSGSNFTSPPSNFYTMIPPQNYEPKAVAQDISQLFTGIRIQCAECHNHPFDRWTQDDYYGFVSFFTGVRRKPAGEPREFYVINDNNAAPMKHLLDGRPMPPKLLGGPAPDVKGKDPRIAFADWLTSPDNQLFRNNMANRVWEHFFGRGIVEPVDDFRISNPPSNRELLDGIGQKLADTKFDLKHLVRDICLSRTYQLSPTTNASNKSDDRQFSHAQLRRLRADVLLDSLSQATETTTRFNGAPRGARAVELFEGGRRLGDYFLKTFGLSSRETVCACETRTEPTFAQSLHLINGRTIQTKIEESKVIENLLKANKNSSEVVDELYVRALSRKPGSDEQKKLLDLIGSQAGERKAFEDVYWALLNSTEFMFNH